MASTQTSTLAAVLAITALVAIIALVLASMAFSQTSLRTARRDAFFYAIGQNPIRTPEGMAGLVLHNEVINRTIQPGETQTIANLRLNTSLLTPADKNLNPQLSLVTSASIPTSANPMPTVDARGIISFIQYTSNLVISPSQPAVNNVLVFRLSDVISGTSHPVVVENTSSLPIYISNLRVLSGAV